MRVEASRSVLVGIAMVWGFVTCLQGGWYDTDWSYRQRVTIRSTLTDSDLTDFPYLVKIVDPTHPVFVDAQSDGDDLLFTDAAGSLKLDHEIERHDAVAKELWVWVRVPLIQASADTDIFLYYGNGSVSSQENIAGVWDSDFVMVQHLEETSGTHFDSTSTGNDGAPNGGVTQNASGKIDGADLFDGSNDYVNIPNDTSLQVVEMTLEAWVYIPTSIPSGFRGIIMHAQSTSNWYGLWKASSGNRFHFRWSSGAVRRLDFNGTISADNWYYVVGVLDPSGNRAMSYLNGDLDKSVSGPSLPTPSAGPTYVGAGFGPGEWFDGFIDEVRISKRARSADWIKATFRNQETPETYQVLAAAEAVPKLVKRAYQLDGTPIATGATLPSGMPVRFLVYLPNTSDPLVDVSVRDVLNPLFGYQPGSMLVDDSLSTTTTCPGGACDEAAILSQVVGSGIPLGDGDSDSDVASYDTPSTTLDLGDGNNANNVRLDVAADSVWALVFTIEMQ